MKSVKEERESLEAMAAEIAKRLEVLQVLCLHTEKGKTEHGKWYCFECGKYWEEKQ